MRNDQDHGDPEAPETAEPHARARLQRLDGYAPPVLMGSLAVERTPAAASASSAPGPDSNAAPRRAYLVPGKAIVVSRAGDLVRVADLAFGTTVRADGALAERVWRSVAEGRTDEVLDRLPLDRPLGRALARLRGESAVPLTPSAALRLAGFRDLFLELHAPRRPGTTVGDPGSRSTGALDRGTCEAVLSDAASIGFERVHFVGGEPLRCSFLPELLAAARAAGLEGAEIVTDGGGLDDRVLEALAPHAPEFAFVVHSDRPAVHDRLAESPGAHARVVDGIRRVRARGLPVRVVVVVTADLAAEVGRTFEFLRALGVERIGHRCAHLVGGPGTVVAAGDALEAREGRGADEPPRGCLTVGHDRRVHPCLAVRSDVVGTLAERTLREIVAAPEPPAPTDRDPQTDFAGDALRLVCRTCRLSGYARRVCFERERT